MVLGPSQFFNMKGLYCDFFNTMRSILMLGKEAKSWFYIKYSMFTHVLVY